MDSLSLETHDNPESNDADLIDLATIHVLQRKGTVYALRDQEMPTKNPYAAIFRY